ncbi:hypothetical protein H6777_01370 [Candidatus Nomurabacteria bacterium]|nr:hypothetical protein [Candidatus Nomurabacteria bacterium]
MGQGDLAAELISNSRESGEKSEIDDLSNWTIVEETDEFVTGLKEEAKKKNQTVSKSDSSDTPIFFR